MALSLLNDNPVDEPNGHLLHKYLRWDQSLMSTLNCTQINEKSNFDVNWHYVLKMESRY